MMIFTETKCVNTRLANFIGTNGNELYVVFPNEQACLTLATFPNEKAAEECLKDIQMAFVRGDATFRVEVAGYGW